MVEDVKCLGTEFDVQSLLHRNSLEQRHVEIRSSRIAQEVSPGSSKRKAGRCCERVRIVKQRRFLPGECGWTVEQVGVADDIGIGSGSHSVSNSGVVVRECDSEGSSGLERGNT